MNNRITHKLWDVNKVLSVAWILKHIGTVLLHKELLKGISRLSEKPLTELRSGAVREMVCYVQK